MGNISKIAALTALITLAFGITAIDVAMAETWVASAETLSSKKNEPAMQITIYTNGKIEVKGLIGQLQDGGAGDLFGNPDLNIAKQEHILKTIGRVGDDIRILWTNPLRCSWLVINGVWKYVCWQE